MTDAVHEDSGDSSSPFSNSTYKGQLSPTGGILSYGSVDQTHRVQYYTFDVPQGVNQLSVHLSASSNDVGYNGYESYYISSFNANKVSGVSSGWIQSINGSVSSSAAGNMLDSIWSVSAGRYTIGVEIDAVNPVNPTQQFNLEIDSYNYSSQFNTSNSAPFSPYSVTWNGDMTGVGTVSGSVRAGSNGSVGSGPHATVALQAGIPEVASVQHMTNSYGAAVTQVTLTDTSGTYGPLYLSNTESFQQGNHTTFFLPKEHVDVSLLYAAAFSRAPDIQGLAYWEDIYDRMFPNAASANPGVDPYRALADTSIPGKALSIADSFIQSKEFQSRYGFLDNTQFINQLYHNTLSRAPDNAGFTYWTNKMNNGDSTGHHMTQAEVLVGFSQSAENISNATHDWLLRI